MLAVLSEIHCLDYLNERGIFPDEYFTDFELFKNRSVSYQDATLVIILAGVCHFSRRHTVEFIKQQYKRKENKDDKGIRDVFVLTDAYIPNLDLYYKFQDNLDEFQKINGMSLLSTAKIDIWTIIDDYQTEGEHKTSVYLSDYDVGSSDEIVDKIKNTSSSEDELIRLIKCPDVKSLINNQ